LVPQLTDWNQTCFSETTATQAGRRTDRNSSKALAHIKPFITPTKIGGRRVIHSTQSICRVSASDVATRDELLNSAVEGLIPHALALNHGIKVIRIHPGNYIVETTADVPCGYTICEPR
jgi:hypothetical protein